MVIEATALGMLAMMKDKNPDIPSLRKAAEYLRGARSGYGGFGATNSTVLALRALTRYAAFSKKTDESGTIQILVDGKKVAEKSYEKGVQDPIEIMGLESFLEAGTHDITVKYAGVKHALPYSLAVNYHTSLPNSQEECVIGLETKLDRSAASMGETVRFQR